MMYHFLRKIPSFSWIPLAHIKPPPVLTKKNVGCYRCSLYTAGPHETTPSNEKKVPQNIYHTGWLFTLNTRAVSWQLFTTKNKSVGAVSKLGNSSRQICWRNQLMVIRLVDLSQMSEASQINLPQPSGPPPKKGNTTPH